jgi:hypothetical protein
MPYASSHIGPIFFVRWRGEIQLADGLPIEFEVKKYRARSHEPLTMIWIVPADLKPMSDGTRLAFSRAIIAVRQHCRDFHVVLEGSGFAQAAYRSLFTTSLSSGSGGPALTLHESAAACLEVVARTYDVEVSALIKTASFQQVITSPIT